MARPAQVEGAVATRTTVPAQRTRRDAPVVVVTGPAAVAERIHRELASTPGAQVRVTSSTADLLRARPPVAAGLVLCGQTLRPGVLRSLAPALRHLGWQSVVLVTPSQNQQMIRFGLRCRIRCLLCCPIPGTEPPRERTADWLPSDREVEVLQALADGLSTRGAARLLGISELTVKSHLARLARKAGTGDRAQLVAMAMRAGFLR